MVMMVEDFADSPACAFGDFASALGGAHSYILAGNGCALADIPRGFHWVKRHQIACAFPNTLGCGSSAFRGSFAHVPGALAHIASGAGLVRLLSGLRPRCVRGLRRRLRLAVLTRSTLRVKRKHRCQKGYARFRKCGSHDLNLSAVRFDASGAGFPRRYRELHRNLN
jgi:hypothetical protein